MSRGRQTGLSYVEVLVAAIIIAIMLVPAINALDGGLRASEAHGQVTADYFHVASGMEEVLAKPFPELDAEALLVGDPTVPTAFSDSPGPSRRLVYLARYDADNADSDDDGFTGTDPDLLWVKVELEKTLISVETLTSR